MARVEGVPLPGQIDLEPSRKIHRRGIVGNADVAHIAGAIARRDAHAAAERQRQMREVAAHAGALFVHIMRGFHVMRMLIAEGDVVMHERADRGDPPPTRRRVAEQRPRDIGQLVGLAVAARHQIEQHVVGQLIDRKLLRGRHDGIGQSGIPHQRAAAQCHAAGRRHQPAADVAKAVVVKSDRHVRLGDDGFGADDVGTARGMNPEHDHHRRRLHRRVSDLEAYLDFHVTSPLLLPPKQR